MRCKRVGCDLVRCDLVRCDLVRCHYVSLTHGRGPNCYPDLDHDSDPHVVIL